MLLTAAVGGLLCRHPWAARRSGLPRGPAGMNPSAGDPSSVPGSGRPPGEGDATHFGAPAGEIRAQRGLLGSSPPGGGAHAAPTGDAQAPLRPRSPARGIAGVAPIVSLHRPQGERSGAATFRETLQSEVQGLCARQPLSQRS